MVVLGAAGTWFISWSTVKSAIAFKCSTDYITSSAVTNMAWTFSCLHLFTILINLSIELTFTVVIRAALSRPLHCTTAGTHGAGHWRTHEVRWQAHTPLACVCRCQRVACSVQHIVHHAHALFIVIRCVLYSEPKRVLILVDRN